MKKNKTIFDKLKLSEVELDDLIDHWHLGESEKPLHDFLGMTWKEYSDWIINNQNKISEDK